jgi:hypothetical protein
VTTRAVSPEILRDRAEIALAFCRECLGWPEASGGYSRYIVENKRRPESSRPFVRMNGFQLDPGDFGHVVNAVREWCDSRAVGLSMKFSPGSLAKDFWHVRVAPHAETQGGDGCDALLRACLTAERNIRGRNEKTVEIEPVTVKHNPAILDNPWGNIRENGATALAFCKECLGWKGAYVYNDCGYVYIMESVPKHLAATPIAPWERQFHFNENHVDKVIDAVRKWCDVRATGFLLEYFPSGSAKNCWNASVGVHAGAHGALASAVLMSACLAAHREVSLPESPEIVPLTAP